MQGEVETGENSTRRWCMQAKRPRPAYFCIRLICFGWWRDTGVIGKGA